MNACHNPPSFVGSADADAMKITAALSTFPPDIRPRVELLIEAVFACGVCIGGEQMQKICHGSLRKAGAA